MVVRHIAAVMVLILLVALTGFAFATVGAVGMRARIFEEIEQNGVYESMHARIVGRVEEKEWPE